ncbi:MAG: IS30 family transposase [Patescibacteria group bacterium]
MHYTHFSKYDRVRLEAHLKAGLTYRRIADLLGYSIGAISYEINENGGKRKYDAAKANQKARRKRKEANQCHRKIGKDDWLTTEVTRLLRKHWSPEQIVGRFVTEKKIKPTSTTAIYDWCNKDKMLYPLLPRKHNKYRRTKIGNDRKEAREELNARRSIDQRPKHIEKRKRIGHWEGDTIIGKEKTARILTHTERKTGYLLANLLHAVSAEKIRIVSIQMFQNIPSNKKQTITYDRGTEFADWELTERELTMQIYFAHAYHSWERGTNENTNGLIRRYFPKKTLFANIEEVELEQIVDEVNHRPRKRLGYRSPYEVFNNVQLRMLI